MDNRERHYMGVGLDNEDGHTRIAKGEGFDIRGGSEETHGKLVEAFVKTSEEVSKKGRRLQETDPREVYERVLEKME